MEKHLKPLRVLARIAFVGILWSIFFIEGIRVIMLINWRFDIFNTNHWVYAWNLWYSGKWVIDDTKEWAFVLIIVSFIPLWLTGWATLSLIPWEKNLAKFATSPLSIFRRLFYRQVQTIKKTVTVNKVQKKKSYKEVRPRGIGGSPIVVTNQAEPMPSSKLKAPQSAPAPKVFSPAPAAARPVSIPQAAAPAEKKAFEHSLFKFDDDEDTFEFNFDALDNPKKEEPKTEKAPAPAPAPKEASPKDNRGNKNDRNRDDRNDKNNKNKDNRNNKEREPQPSREPVAASTAKPAGNSTLEVLKQKGYEVITGATLKNNLIDFIGVSKSQICLCICDKETGDWLADEERFNDEEPLWFSESSHRISPVRKIDIAKKFLRSKLEEQNLSFEIKAYVIIQIGNIINAEDMFEIWDELDISVTRIDRGSPKELKLFSRTLDDAEEAIKPDAFEKLKKLIRNIS